MATIGIDIGGTKVAAGVVSAEGHLLGEPAITPTPAQEGPEAICRVALAMARRAAGNHPGTEITAVGAGSGGVFDRSGAVISSTGLLKGWTGTPLAAILSADLGLPAIALNDAQAAAIGEARAGAAAGYRHVLVVAVGTGIGGAFVRQGHLEPGPDGIFASVGHLPLTRAAATPCSCGVAGHLEAYASGPAIERAYAAATGQAAHLPEIASRACDGDQAAATVIFEAATALGEGLAAAANLLDPDCIVIGGGVAGLGDALFDPARAAYRAHVLPPGRNIPILPAALGAHAAIVGAGLAAGDCA